ncbi:MAG: amidohydrolase family protein [Anaerolineaceae bacterium]|nr:amidohydrolase family protein [Anaerolineaceae bacterium]
MRIAEIISAAAGKNMLDIVIRNVNLVNVFTCEIYKADIGIYKNRIVSIDSDGTFELKADKVIDGTGKWASPGFIDAHLHIESSMVTPANYAVAVLPHGVTTAVIDPHEIGNVMGKAGIKYMIEGSEGLPLRVFITLPSSVPSVPGCETSGAIFDSIDMKEMLSWDRVIGLGEIMDFIGVAAGEKRIIDIIQTAVDVDGFLQGHAPMMTGRPLQAYVAAGIRDDHETINGEECIEKIRLGLKPLLRVQSKNHHLQQTIPVLKNLPFLDEVGLCTDDVFPDVSVAHGHMDFAVREVIANGIEPAVAIRWATLNNARNDGLKQLGAIAPGYLADIVLLSSLEEVIVSDVISDGKLVVKNGELSEDISDPMGGFKISNTVNISELTKASFELMPPVKNGEVKVNVFVKPEDRFYTSSVQRTAQIVNGKVDLDSIGENICLMTVVPRHGQKHENVVVPVDGLGITNGALATTISHDSHNLIVAGSNPEDMLLAVNELKRCAGGISVVQSGQVLSKLELPIAGLLSVKPIDEVAKELKLVHNAALQIGMKDFKPNAATILNYFALIVIPEVRISDLGGLFDVYSKEFIPVFPKRSSQCNRLSGNCVPLGFVQAHSGERILKSHSTLPAAGSQLQVEFPGMKSQEILLRYLIYFSILKLAVVQLSIETASFQQFFMFALLDNITFVHHQDQIGVADGGETVGDDKTGAVPHQVVHSFLDQYLGAGIDRTGSFI